MSHRNPVPFYKKWWFKLIAAPLLVGLILLFVKKEAVIPSLNLSGSPVNPQYNAGRDMAVYNIGSIDQLVTGARPEEIESVRQMATASIFKTASDPLREMVHNNLERVREQFASPLPMVTISADKANPNRLKIADEMGELLRASGFEVKVRGSRIDSESREPIKVIFRPKDRKLAEAMLMAFNPILNANVGAQEVANRPGDEIVVLIMGEPRFTPEGVKAFE